MRKNLLFLAGTLILVLLELIYLDYKISDKIDRFEQAQVIQTQEILRLDIQLTKISKSLPGKSNGIKELQFRFTNHSEHVMNNRQNLYLFAAAEASELQSKINLP